MRRLFLFVPISLLAVSVFFVYVYAYQISILDGEHHPQLLPNHLMLLIPQAFAAENLFYGYSSFEKFYSITPDETSTFELKIRYTEGPYQISDLTPVFDVSPENAALYLHIKTNPIGLTRNDVGRIQNTITVDSQTEYKEIFVNVYFNGTDSYGNPYKSAWMDSVTINIVQPKSAVVTQKCSETILGTKYGTPIDLEYDIDGGTVVSNCKFEDTNSVITKIDADSDGQITITIPKKIVYSISSPYCDDDADLLILMDNEEILPASVIHGNKDNTITVEFSKGIHTIEFVGVSIMPDPSPSQYCGFVMGFDSLYLPPKFQIELGMKTEQVKCNEDLALLKKASNDLPICVSFETGQKLLERNLAHTIARTGTTYSDNEDSHRKEITILSISPKNVTLPEPKSQTSKTTCNADGVCFTPE